MLEGDSLPEDSDKEKCEDFSPQLIEFNQKLTKLIDDANAESLKCFIELPDSVEKLVENPFEILEVVVPYLRLRENHENLKKHEIQSCALQVLHYMSDYCKATELLLFMIEHLEKLKSDEAYFLLLNPLKSCLLKSRNCLLMIDICFDNIHENFNSMSLSKDETNENFDSIITSYKYVADFVDNLYYHLTPRLKDETVLIQMKTKYLIVDFLLSLFGKPICYASMNNDQIELIFQEIFANLFSLEYDIIYFFRFIKYGNLYKYRMSSGPNVSAMNFYNSSYSKLFSLVSDLSLGNFYWITLSQKQNLQIAQVYNPYYIAYNCINTANFFLSDSEGRNIMIIKALDLVSFALKILKDRPIPFEALDLPIHNEIMKNLANCIIYGPLKYQKVTLDSFIKYINVFEIDAKYVVIKNIIRSNYHSKITGVVIGVLKDIVAETSLKKDECSKNKTFLQDNLQVLISLICVLDQDIETDLLEISDQLISTLNFIIFLLLRSETKNLIFNILQESVRSYLRIVKIALEKQKVEWRKTIDDAYKKPNNNGDEQNKPSRIGLPEPTKEEQISMSENAMNKLLMIENIVERIDELYV